MGLKPGAKLGILQENANGFILMCGDSRIGIDSKLAQNLIVIPNNEPKPKNCFACSEKNCSKKSFRARSFC